MSEEYVKTPLVVWLQTFSIEAISFSDLVDGYFLNEVFQQIDNKCSLEGTVSKIEDVNDKIQNWETLLKNIRAFYQEVLQQYIIMKPPDIFLICYHPDTAAAKDQLDASILFLLGCAVQCEERENYIDTIKGLDVEVQHSIMQCIKKVTDFSKSVLNVNIPLKDIDDSSLTLYTHLSNLINQRDTYIQEIKALHQTLNVISIDDFGRITLDGQWGTKNSQKSRASNRLSLINLEMSSLVGQAEYKAVLRKLKQELLDKSDIMVDMEDELDLLKKDFQKMKIENFDLIQQVRIGKFYRDELDIYKEKAEAVEKLEKEIQKYKDQMIEFDYYKDRVEELRVDNCVLMDNKKLLEEQLESLKQKSQLLLDAEMDLLKCKKALENSYKEHEEDKEKLKCLMVKVERFEREKEAKKRVSFMEDSFHAPPDFDPSGTGLIGSLADQLLQASQSQIIALEAKLQKLELEMEDKFYLSDNVLKAFDLNNIKIISEVVSGRAITNSNEEEEEGDDQRSNVEMFVTREELEKELLKRVTLLKDDNERSKTQIKSFNVALDSSKEKIKSMEESNSKVLLDKQQLALNFEASERKVNNLIDEREKLESELTELKKMVDVCLKRIKDLEGCFEEVKAKDEGFLLEKIEFEKETRRLKLHVKEKSSVIEELEININDLNVEIADLRQATESQKELETKFHDIEVAVQTLSQAGVLDKKLITSLREELVNEKIRNQNISDDLAKVNRKCEAYVTGETVPPKLRLIERMYEDKMCESETKQKKIDELEERLNDYELQVNKLQSELSVSIKKDEKQTAKDRTLIVTQRYGQSPSATQEILKLKDSLMKGEHQRDSLIQETTDLRQQLEYLQNSLDRQSQVDKSHLDSLEAQLQRNLSLLAGLQVEHATIQMQNSALETQVAQLKLSLTETESKVECLASERNSLEDNCRALQKLHDKLGVEYERLQEDYISLKGIHRLLKTDLKSAKDKISSLEKNLEKLKNCSSSIEVTSLKEENGQLQKTVENLEIDNKNLSGEMRKSKLEIGRLKESLQNVQKQLAENRNTIVDLDSELERLRRIEHMYNRTEEENQILNDQLRMYKTSLEDVNTMNTENHQTQQKSLIERLAEMKSKSLKSESPTEKNKKKSTTKPENGVIIRRNRSIQEKNNSDQSEVEPRREGLFGSPLRKSQEAGKSQEDFLSIEDSPNYSEKAASPFENFTKFGDWRIKSVFRKIKSVENSQQTSSPIEKPEVAAKRKFKRVKASGGGSNDPDDETITLNQFLSECNQSPKSRRKLLIQKRVALDDDVFCDKDLSLDPRPPVVFDNKSQTLCRSFKSEGSFFNNTDDNKLLLQDRKFTPVKSRFVAAQSNAYVDERTLVNERSTPSAKTSQSQSLHHSKSFQDDIHKKESLGPTKQKPKKSHLFTKEPLEMQDETQCCDNSNYKKVNSDSYKTCSSEARLGLCDVRKNSNSVKELHPRPTLSKKMFRSNETTPEYETPISKGKFISAESKSISCLHNNSGVVKNLVDSYQKGSSSPIIDDFQAAHSRDIVFSKSNVNQINNYDPVRPRSAGLNAERTLHKKFGRDQINRREDSFDQPNSGNPKICLVRPATASSSKYTQRSTDIYPIEINILKDGSIPSNEIPQTKSGTSNKSKTFYEYSCI